MATHSGRQTIVNPYTQSSNVIYNAEFLSPGEQSMLGGMPYNQASVDAYFQNNPNSIEVEQQIANQKWLDNMNKIQAEKEQKEYERKNAWWKPLVGSIAGGLLGAIAGPTGALIGSQVGGALGIDAINFLETDVPRFLSKKL